MIKQTEPTKPEDTTAEEWLALCRRDVEELVASLKGMNTQLTTMPPEVQASIHVHCLRLRAVLSMWGDAGSAALVLVATTIMLEEANTRLASAMLAVAPVGTMGQQQANPGPLH